MKLPVAALISSLLAAATLFGEPRAASDFEIAAMQKQVVSTSDAFSRLSAHLNLGDLFLARGEVAIAHDEYREALAISGAEMKKAREDSGLARYARAASYAGLASAKLGRAGAAMRLLEESLRYDSDSASAWNVYASSMTVLGQDVKAVSAARNAVAIATRDSDDGASQALDLNIYRYSLASALSRVATDGADREAEELLEQIVLELAGARFDALRKTIARREQFEIFSSTRSDASAYLSLLNRSRLRLARIFEESERDADAREQYRAVLRERIDDPTALAGMARLASGGDRQRYFDESFEASPFSLPLIRQYEDFLRDNPAGRVVRNGSSSIVQKALVEAAHGRHRAAVELLEPLARSHPDNSTLRYLLARSEVLLGRFDRARAHLATAGMPRDLSAELIQLLSEEESAASMLPSFLTSSAPETPVKLSSDELSGLLRLLRTGSLAPEHMSRLDALRFIAPVSFDSATASDGETTTFSGGSVHRQPFRFASPTTFRGRYDAGTQHQLEFQILGLTQADGRELLLLQPWRVNA